MTVEWIASCAACTVAAVVNVAALAFRYSDQGTRKSANASSSSLPPARYSSATGVSGGACFSAGVGTNVWHATSYASPDERRGAREQSS